MGWSPKTQVRDGHAARLLGVVLEVGLDILVGVVADDLDRVLVGADGAVATETPELALDGALSGGVGRIGVHGQRQVGDVVHDADGELLLGLVSLELLVDGEGSRGRLVLRTEAVAAADDLDAGEGRPHRAWRRRPRRAARRGSRAPWCGRARRSSSRSRGAPR